MLQPQIIIGGSATDERGTIQFNNEFDLTEIKRVYSIHNKDVNFTRGWQGHLIEQRWFTVMEGGFEIDLIDYNKFEEGIVKHLKFVLSSPVIETLHIPAGYMSAIRATTANNKLLVYSDYLINEVKDEYRFNLGHFGIFQKI